MCSRSAPIAGQISRTGTLAFQGRTKQTTQRKALRSAQETMARKLTVGAQFRVRQ